MTDIYESEHYGAYTEFHEGKRSLPQWCKPFFDKFPLKRGRLLDIGCGDGIFLKHAEELGFEIWGIDFDKRSIENARRRFGFNNLYTKTLEEFVSYAETNDLSFDVITFFEVLEHQGRPLEFINNVRKVLKADGYIAGSVPNRERLFAEADRRLFMADYPPHHFLWFSKEAIRMFFVNNNFQSVALFPVKLNIVRISEWLESVMLGKLSKEIKKRLMASLFRQYVKDERDLGKTVETFELLYGKDKKTVFLKFLRGIRNLFFCPLV